MEKILQILLGVSKVHYFKNKMYAIKISEDLLRVFLRQFTEFLHAVNYEKKKYMYQEMISFLESYAS